ncbi:rps6 [Symbiodinium pilosum]|uniref:Rps6 protein n=1 Tax=Symbiodinium pilosum TaxID=2952 RepID=A0A812XVC3_SYMPI|nr:rps6 [Symbiodinium pilosum]
MTSTPLHQAILLGDLEAVKSLLQRKSEAPRIVNLPDLLLERPLHVAARSGGEHVRSMTRALIAARADLNLQNKLGETPLDYAAYWQMEHALVGEFRKERHCKQVARILCKAGGVRKTTCLNNQHWNDLFQKWIKLKGNVEEIVSSTSGEDASVHTRKRERERLPAKAARARVFPTRTARTDREAPTKASAMKSNQYRSLPRQGIIRLDALLPYRKFFSNCFRDGRRLAQLVEELISGRWPVLDTEFLRLRCVLVDGRLFCRDVHRLWCLKAYQDHLQDIVFVNVNISSEKKATRIRRRRRKRSSDLEQDATTGIRRPGGRQRRQETAQKDDVIVVDEKMLSCSAASSQMRKAAKRAKETQSRAMKDPDGWKPMLHLRGGPTRP